MKIMCCYSVIFFKILSGRNEYDPNKWAHLDMHHLVGEYRRGDLSMTKAVIVYNKEKSFGDKVPFVYCWFPS